MSRPRPEYFEPRVRAAAIALRQIDVSFLRALRSKKYLESEREDAALEIAYRMLYPEADWPKSEIERGLPR